jgi:hypothetical protein
MHRVDTPNCTSPDVEIESIEVIGCPDLYRRSLHDA